MALISSSVIAGTTLATNTSPAGAITLRPADKTKSLTLIESSKVFKPVILTSIDDTKSFGKHSTVT
ncbi:MAG: hypothetical protein ACD_72C00205G0001 [uncultured bacterium]|nr:MAG: hypothetical protein ACD_72C00205G0001 [uncultured bacterium]